MPILFARSLCRLQMSSMRRKEASGALARKTATTQINNSLTKSDPMQLGATRHHGAVIQIRRDKLNPEYRSNFNVIRA
ncbi:hypothetical protein [Xanthomonas euvesicatoria]|uniref:hypothetical protein n=1 Tax=Xanthomonas euvesicatoria TaxID=456327 RepID=UPI000F8E0658|nr:hypothetical protein [Xanthomonas euvesicatoria]MCC8576379.1 hypothetical protein [Xanthomonas euvesicatoria pv. euvesicatoria]MCC8776928.1 hypothetical protein [Xanthomonas euvesicatoria pv. euvesicatoria]MCC8818578.1 hypothetical protein [Xanthomonas euvesicatoria pv. euvesicatoria]